MTTHENRQSSWKECGPGTLGIYANRQKSRILKGRMVGAGSVASICLLVALAWNTLLPQTTVNTKPKTSMEPNYGGIVCSSVKAVAKAHLAGTLDTETNQKIELHLQECLLCRAYMEQLGNVQANTSVRSGNPKTSRFVLYVRSRLAN